MSANWLWVGCCALAVLLAAGCTRQAEMVEVTPDDPTIVDMIAGGLGQAPEGEDPEVAQAFEAKGWRLYRDFNINTGAPMVMLDVNSKLEPADYELIAKSKTVTTMNLMSAEPTDAGLATIATLPTLETLLLMGDTVTNEGVKSLAGCPSLRVLHVTMCKDISDDGIAPLGKLPNLETLAVSRAKLSGECLAEFADHPKLKVLHLHDLVGFTDAGAEHLAKIPHLEDLELKSATYGNPPIEGGLSAAGIRAIVEGNLPARFECDEKLVDDELFVAMIEQGWIPPNDEIKVAETPGELRVLLLEGYPLGDAGFRALAKFPNVSHVSARGTPLSDTAFEVFKNYRELDWLHVEGGAGSGQGLSAVEKLPIEHLALEECELTEDHFKAIGKMKQLDELWLSDSKFDAAWLKHIAGLPQLTELSLRSAAFNDDAAAVVAKLPMLAEITANDTELGDKGFALLLAHPQLKTIYVNGTQVTQDVYVAAKKKYPDRSFYFYRYDNP